MTSDELQRKLYLKKNFIALKRFDYSLAKLLKRYPDGVPDEIIAHALSITVEEVEMIYQDIIDRLAIRINGS